MKTSDFWHSTAKAILRYRVPLLVIAMLMTVFMWVNRGQKYVQDFAKIIPPEDPEYVEYLKFKKEFGEDGNVVAIGVEGDIFKLEFFNALYDLTDSLRALESAESVISIAHLYDLQLDTVAEKFSLQPLLAHKPRSQAELDSLKERLQALPFYDRLIIGKDERTTLIALAFKRSHLDTEKKMEAYESMERLTEAFGEKFNTEVRYAGFPVLRVNSHRGIGKEVGLFLGLAIIVSAITVFIFFRSLTTTLFSLLIVGAIIVWSMGLIGLFGYRIDLMLAMTPALITVIAIPNCVYLITKYHILYRELGNKHDALVGVIRKLGVAAVLTNASTAAGLGTNLFTDIVVLRQFGVIGGLSVVVSFFLSVVLVPVVFSFLPDPTPKQTRHLDRKELAWILAFLDRAVNKERKWIFLISGVMFIGSVIGISMLKARAYVADDLPKKEKVYNDLKFMEDRFSGVLPIEIVVDTKSKLGLAKISNIRKIAELQDSLATYPDISRSMSVADLVKFGRQSMVYGGRSDYDLPSKSEYDFIKMYIKNTKMNTGGLNKTLVDTAFQKARITANIRDIGSEELGKVIKGIQADVDSIFPKEDYKVTITGTTKIFVKGNDFLIDNLIQSIVLAFFLIALLMGARSPKIIVLSLAANILPLLMVAGFMGFAGIPLKPSTAIVFGTAFGISVDTATYFLIRYRMGLKIGYSSVEAVLDTFQDTGIGVIYTSVTLFFGFIIFIISNYGGTQMLGLLTALTIIISTFGNLLLLPALLLRFDNRPGKPNHPTLSHEEDMIP